MRQHHLFTRVSRPIGAWSRVLLCVPLIVRILLAELPANNLGGEDETNQLDTLPCPRCGAAGELQWVGGRYECPNGHDPFTKEQSDNKWKG